MQTQRHFIQWARFFSSIQCFFQYSWRCFRSHTEIRMEPGIIASSILQSATATRSLTLNCLLKSTSNWQVTLVNFAKSWGKNEIKKSNHRQDYILDLWLTSYPWFNLLDISHHSPSYLEKLKPVVRSRKLFQKRKAPTATEILIINKQNIYIYTLLLCDVFHQQFSKATAVSVNSARPEALQGIEAKQHVPASSGTRL